MRILIADDDPVWRRMIEAMLVEFGDDVQAVADGAEAWEVLDSGDRPALAILDWVMPGIDGIEICRRLRAAGEGPYVYVLLLTVKDRKADIVEGFKAGADDYICKPFDPEELRGRLRAAQRVMAVHANLLGVQHELREQATRDSLTGLWNRGAIMDLLGRELVRGQRAHSPVGIMIADVDHFKRINDTHGHAAGDAVLRQLAERFLRTVRAYDCVGRYGGEEILFALPACDLELASRSGERVRASVTGEPFDIESAHLPVTVTLGVASSFLAPGADAKALVAAADAALYRGKAGGRNRVEPATAADVAAVAARVRALN
jgi:two-component system, cell cycle response regulator